MRALRQVSTADDHPAGQVQRINLGSSKKHATGVTYIDAAGREFEQPASLVITSMFAINNVRMLLLSGIDAPYDPATGQGVVGRNYAYQTMSAVASFFDEDVIVNPFMASGASGTLINDFAGDKFDHSGLGFIGGAFIGAVNTNGRPIQYHPVPTGTPRWGKGWKQAVVKHYNHTVMFSFHGSSAAQRGRIIVTSIPRIGMPGVSPYCELHSISRKTVSKWRSTSRARGSRSAKRWALNRWWARRAGATPACEACHGAHGEGLLAVHAPRIAGQSADYLKKQLDDYASGTRDNAVMAMIARTLSDQERTTLVARYAAMSVPYAAQSASSSAAQLVRGHQLGYQGDENKRVQACNNCHGPDGSGLPHSAPYLAGQWAEYLASAIKAWQQGTRKSDAGH